LQGGETMKAILEIELFNDGTRQELKMWKNIGNAYVPGLGTITFGGMPPSGWVAEITGFDPKYKYARTFLKFKKDYSRANSKGSRGIFAEYILEEGKIYDVEQQVTWKRSKRYFCTVKDWKIVEIDEMEVILCLNERSWSTSAKPQNNG
jgi:hypothetical protein